MKGTVRVGVPGRGRGRGSRKTTVCAPRGSFAEVGSHEHFIKELDFVLHSGLYPSSQLQFPPGGQRRISTNEAIFL